VSEPTQDATPLTIDELAREVGMTVRNVRAHQSRGLLPPPELRGRTGFYGQEHVARLELVKDLQAEGFNLEAIKRILERTPAGGVAEVLDFTRAVAEPFTDEEPEILDVAALAAPWGDQGTPELLKKLERTGFLRRVDDERVEILSPRLQRAVEELAASGIRLETLVGTSEALRKHSEGIAKAFVKLFLEDVWKPFVASGEPEERWPEVRKALEDLRPIATEAAVGAFQVVMTEQVERALERELGRLGGQKR
jgi:DNA-binding transcriptional MerR regulator